MVRRWRPTVFTLAQAAAAGVVIVRLLPGARRPAPLEPLPGSLEGPPSVSVIVPARDEEHRIGPLLAALAKDPQVGEVVVVDDESTDATAALASAAGARVVVGRPLPAGWVGKPWALQQGLEAVSSEWVVTLDADVVPNPGFVGGLLAAATADGWDVLTVGPRFVLGGAAEQLLHPAMLATIVYRFGAPSGTASARRVLANGQCLVARRQRLAELGGFASAAGHMTDDIALARGLAARGARVGFLDGSRLVEVDMHDSAAELWREWGRSLPMADVTAPLQQVGDLAVVWLAQALPLPRLLAGRGTPADVALVLLRLGLGVATAGSYRRPAPLTWAAPLTDVPAAGRLTWGAIRPVRSWRGRHYPPGPQARSAGRSG
ncbi:MAG: glycosyltransferase [Acidimicrobiales bacterium]